MTSSVSRGERDLQGRPQLGLPDAGHGWLDVVPHLELRDADHLIAGTAQGLSAALVRLTVCKGQVVEVAVDLDDHLAKPMTEIDPR